VIPVQGDHNQLLTYPFVEAVAAAVSARLSR
jgi:hypothetical protein